MIHRLLPLALLATAPAIQAEDAKPTHVVELFTSQGCSSCPPANRFVGELAETPGTLVLSYGVTYWDYLGWTDTFGDPAFTERQRDYRDAFGAANIYTPQIVLGGAAHSPRYSKRDVASMPLEREDVGLRIRTENGAQCFIAETDRPVLAEIVTYMPGEQTVDVARGENRGRALTLTNVVTDVEDWTIGSGPSEFCVTPERGRAFAALIHDATSAKILDAAVIE